ncbi:formin-like protein 6 isoform X2 [Alosa alosa]|nr:formin-like protein 6 isoform X2 [Alosa alosa]
MQLSIMNKVKSGELSIDDAIDQARKNNLELFQQKEKQATQYNFSVHKFNRYRWQKRVLQVDFNTKMVCSIEKGIIKRQLPFACVKNCHDGTGTKFSISFKGRHDYELEATSMQEKQKMLQLVSQIIHSNIYSQSADRLEDVYQMPPDPKSLRQGQLLLQKGGMASFKWKRYEAHLHAGQLTLLSTNDGDAVSSSTLPIVIHFSDGKARVETSHSFDTFTLHTHCSAYQFRVPMTDVMKTADIQTERDSWVQAIGKLCMNWKCCSQSEPMYADLKKLRASRTVTGLLQHSEDGAFSGTLLPSTEEVSDGEESTALSSVRAFPLPPTPALAKPCSPVCLPTMPSASPLYSDLHPVAPSPPVPAPPPLPRKKPLPEDRTKAFHWDLLPQDKIDKSFWTHGVSGKAKIDTFLLFEQFKVKVSENVADSVDSSHHIEIMLNQKIAHNFTQALSGLQLATPNMATPSKVAKPQARPGLRVGQSEAYSLTAPNLYTTYYDYDYHYTNIFLKSFPVQPKELREKLCIIHEKDGGLSDEQIASLRRYVPTVEDVEMYKSYKGVASDLHIVDQYMLEMCNISFLSSRLDLLLTLRELPITMEDLEPLINQKIRMCQQLIGSQTFVCVLEYLLAVGNYLNEHAGKDKAKGFRLSSLIKLSQLRGVERHVTLLHALAEQIVLHEPGLATFPSELAEFDTVPGASIKGLTAEIDVVKNELQKALQYKKSYTKKNPIPQHPKFSKDLKAAIEKYNMDLQQLTKKSEEMRKIYSDILVKFGEAADQDSQELFGWVCQFITEFKKAHAELSK